jgi:hypothetical protein
VVVGRRGERVEVDDAAVARLRGADRHERGAPVDRLGHPLERHLGDAHAARRLGEHREEHGGEVTRGDEDLVARLERGGDEAGEDGDLRPAGDVGGGHARQAGEGGPGALDGLVVEGPVDAALGPRGEGLARGLGGGGRRHAGRRGVEVARHPREAGEDVLAEEAHARRAVSVTRSVAPPAVASSTTRSSPRRTRSTGTRKRT